MRNRRLPLVIVTVVLAVASGGAAMAQFPEGQKTGAAPQTSSALVTINIPSVVGIDVEHNFVLNLASNGCWGTGAAFPNLAGSTTYTFAVESASIGSSADVACVATSGGGQADTATIKVFSTSSTAVVLKAKITDGGFGTSSGTLLSTLVPDIWSGKLSLIDFGDTCGGGTKVFPAFTAANSDVSLVTGIPATPFSDCRQKLQLVMNAVTTAYASGVATAKMTYTIGAP